MPALSVFGDTGAAWHRMAMRTSSKQIVNCVATSVGAKERRNVYTQRPSLRVLDHLRQEGLELVHRHAAADVRRGPLHQDHTQRVRNLYLPHWLAGLLPRQCLSRHWAAVPQLRLRGASSSSQPLSSTAVFLIAWPQPVSRCETNNHINEHTAQNVEWSEAPSREDRRRT